VDLRKSLQIFSFSLVLIYLHIELPKEIILDLIILILQLVEAHGQRSSKTSSLFLYRGSRIMELDACGLKLEASTVGLEACCLELEACGLTLETLIV
jgi:hypothetical protein